jgi:hypothetical protein
VRSRLGLGVLWVLILLTLSACQTQGQAAQRAPAATPTTSGVEYELVAEPLHARVGSEQAQEIRVWVRRRGMPELNVQPVLALTMPNGSTNPFVFPPTNGNGETRMTVFPVKASSGTLVPYRVCLYLPQAEEKCVEDSYLIWNEK